MRYLSRRRQQLQNSLFRQKQNIQLKLENHLRRHRRHRLAHFRRLHLQLLQDILTHMLVLVQE